MLARLDEQVVAGRNLDGDAIARVSCPDVQAWITGAAMDGEEVEVCVEAGKNCIVLAIFDEIRGCWGEEMRAILSGV